MFVLFRSVYLSISLLTCLNSDNESTLRDQLLELIQLPSDRWHCYVIRLSAARWRTWKLDYRRPKSYRLRTARWNVRKPPIRKYFSIEISFHVSLLLLFFCLFVCLSNDGNENGKSKRPMIFQASGEGDGKSFSRSVECRRRGRGSKRGSSRRRSGGSGREKRENLTKSSKTVAAAAAAVSCFLLSRVSPNFPEKYDVFIVHNISKLNFNNIPSIFIIFHITLLYKKKVS